MTAATPRPLSTAALASPFTHGTPEPAVPDSLARSATRVQDVQRVDKPWGHEEIFGVLEGRYVGKVLHITAGAALSLQRHLMKDETLAVRSGRITVDCGEDPRRLERLELVPGQQVLIRAGVVHRISAAEDSEVLEVSTAWPGWRTDVVRLDDAYGRQGRTEP
jgi:mannose-6-phosphate isomerase